MAQQALSVAVSSTGLPKLFNAFVISGATFAAQLNQEKPSDQNLNIGDVDGNNCFDYVLALNGGSFSGATATMNSVTQSAAGSASFTVAFTVNMSVNYAVWSETWTRYISGFHGGPGVNVPEGPVDCGADSFSATGVSLTAKVEFAQGAGNGPWALAFVSAQSDSLAATINISYPNGSILNGLTNTNCHGDDLIKSSLESAIQTIDYSSAVDQTMTPILAQLKDSGQLTAAIAFDWTPNTFAFPPTISTLQAGVTGIVSYKGTSFAPTTPPNVSLPDLPVANDIRLFAADDLFSSLFWAYFQAGSLSQTITPGMLPEPTMLNTSYYATLLPDLSRQYPDCPMNLVVEQSAAPTVTFDAAYLLPYPYELTPAALLGLQPTLKRVLSPAEWAALAALENQGQIKLEKFQLALQAALTATNYTSYGASIVTAASSPTLPLGSGGMPAAAYSNLLNLVNIPFPTQARFEAALANALTAPVATQYQTVILNAAAAVIANLAHAPTLTFNVLSNGADVPVLVIQLQESDVLTGFQIAASAANQTIQSTYQMQQQNTKPTLVSTTISGVNLQTFLVLWQVMFSGIYASIMQTVASTGVPLPFIQGYRFQNSLITLNVGYADVAADIQYLASGD